MSVLSYLTSFLYNGPIVGHLCHIGFLSGDILVYPDGWDELNSTLTITIVGDGTVVDPNGRHSDVLSSNLACSELLRVKFTFSEDPSGN